MDLVDYKDTIIVGMADAACNKLSIKVVRSLQKMTEHLLSGDDSGLKNIWDEVCVQVRGEHSIYWSFYLITIESIISDELDKLDTITREAIWLQTDEGRTWAEEEEDYHGYLNEQDDLSSPNKRESAPSVNDYESSYYILHNYVLSAADNWTNKRIENYLAVGYNA